MQCNKVFFNAHAITGNKKIKRVKSLIVWTITLEDSYLKKIHVLCLNGAVMVHCTVWLLCVVLSVQRSIHRPEKDKRVYSSPPHLTLPCWQQICTPCITTPLLVHRLIKKTLRFVKIPCIVLYYMEMHASIVWLCCVLHIKCEQCKLNTTFSNGPGWPLWQEWAKQLNIWQSNCCTKSVIDHYKHKSFWRWAKNDVSRLLLLPWVLLDHYNINTRASDDATKSIPKKLQTQQENTKRKHQQTKLPEPSMP